MYGYIYLTTNSANGKIYIGQKKSSTFLGEKYLGSGVRLQSAIKHHGRQAFSVKLIDTAEDYETLNEKEIYWINHYNSTDSNIGYNISFGGGVLDGFEVWNKGKKGLITYSEETKKKMSIHHLGQTRSEETKNKISSSNKGKKRTEEQNQQNRERNVGRKWINKDGVNKTVPESKVNQYISSGWLLGRLEKEPRIPWNKGLTKQKDKRVEQYSINRTGIKHTEDSNKRNRENHLGRKHINNGFIGKTVFQTELNSYLNNGWVLGMLKKSHT